PRWPTRPTAVSASSSSAWWRACCLGRWVPSARTLEQARRVAQFRTRVLRDFGGLTAAEVSRLNGSDASNKSQLAYRWRKDGRIFAVPHRGRTWYPAFQFGPDGQPLAGVAEVLRIWVTGRSGTSPRGSW